MFPAAIFAFSKVVTLGINAGGAGMKNASIGRETLDLKFRGIRQTLDNLDALDKRLKKKILSKAIRESLKIVQKDAKQRIPLGEAKNAKEVAKLRSLRKSIRIKIRATEAYMKNGIGYGVVGQYYDARFDWVLEIPPGMRGRPLAGYARKVEFEKKSYMRAALDQNRAKVLIQFKNVLDSEIQKETSILYRMGIR